jgi:glycerol kinase
MATTEFTNGATLTDADWFDDVDAHVYEKFGATGGSVFIGDSANANVTIGLTINQGSNDDQILALKSSDVAHGITDAAETDTYGLFGKVIAASGGMLMRGLSEGAVATTVDGIATSSDTTKSTAGTGALELRTYLKSGTSSTTHGANANLVVIGNGAATTRFIFDAEGDFHADSSSTTFDDYDDLALVEAIDRGLQKDPVNEQYAEHLKAHKQTLQDFYDPEGKRAMVNVTKQARLHNGAIRQLASMLNQAMLKIEQLETKLLDAK